MEINKSGSPPLLIPSKRLEISTGERRPIDAIVGGDWGTGKENEERGEVDAMREAAGLDSMRSVLFFFNDSCVLAAACVLLLLLAITVGWADSVHSFTFF